MSDLPVYEIIEAIQFSQNPKLQNLSSEVMYEIENSLSKSVDVRRRPRFKPAVIRPSDTELSAHLTIPIKDASGKQLKDKRGLPKVEVVKNDYFIRIMDTGDAFDIAAIGPQIIEEFFAGDMDKVASMALIQIAQEVILKSVSQRLANAMTDLAEAVIDKALNLVINKETMEPITFDEFILITDPVESETMIRKSLEVNALFFSYLGSRVPGNIKGAMRSLSGTLSTLGNQVADLLN